MGSAVDYDYLISLIPEDLGQKGELMRRSRSANDVQPRLSNLSDIQAEIAAHMKQLEHVELPPANQYDPQR